VAVWSAILATAWLFVRYSRPAETTMTIRINLSSSTKHLLADGDACWWSFTALQFQNPQIFIWQMRVQLLEPGEWCRPDTAQTIYVDAESRLWLYLLTKLWGPSWVSCVKAQRCSALVIFTAIFAIHWTENTYIFFSRQIKTRFSAPKMKKKTKFGRPLISNNKHCKQFTFGLVQQLTKAEAEQLVHKSTCECENM